MQIQNSYLFLIFSLFGYDLMAALIQNSPYYGEFNSRFGLVNYLVLISFIFFVLKKMEGKKMTMAPPNSFFPRKSDINLRDLPPITPSPFDNNPTTQLWHEKPFGSGYYYPGPPRHGDSESVIDLIRKQKFDSSKDAVRNIRSRMEGSAVRWSQENSKPQFFAGEDGRRVALDASIERQIDPSRRKSAKLQLHAVCTVKKWKAPVYTCCKEEGPPHFNLFTFKVVIEIAEESTLFECFGAPHSKKKTAAEHAAEGALWYLQSMGQLPLNKNEGRIS